MLRTVHVCFLVLERIVLELFLLFIAIQTSTTSPNVTQPSTSTDYSDGSRVVVYNPEGTG